MNKRAYVIFTGTITRMGGAQMYVANKVKYMQNLGWTVYVYSGLKGPIIINDLLAYEKMIYDDLNNYPLFFTRKKVSLLVESVVNQIQAESFTEIIIESNTPHICCWAELVAQKLNAKHYMFLLDEQYDIDMGIMPFFEFKFGRREVAFINEKSVGLLFKDKALNVNANDYILEAACNNVVEDIIDPRFEEIDYTGIDYTICSLGRLNKPYIPNVIEGFEQFARSNPDKRIVYIFIGDQPKEFVPDMMEQIKNHLGQLKNVCLYTMGYVYPVPQSLFLHLDLVVASAGSSRVTWAYNIPTISMDASDGNPIGVLGYDTENTLYRGENEKGYELSVYLDKVLQGDYLKGKRFIPYVLEDNSVYMDKHLIFVNASTSESSYYPVLSCTVFSTKNKVKSLLIKTLGINAYNSLQRLKRKIK